MRYNQNQQMLLRDVFVQNSQNYSSFDFWRANKLIPGNGIAGFIPLMTGGEIMKSIRINRVFVRERRSLEKRAAGPV